MGLAPDLHPLPPVMVQSVILSVWGKTVSRSALASELQTANGDSFALHRQSV